jgi:hypothetical protein
MKGRQNLDDPGTSGKIILKFISKKLEGMPRTGFIWLRTDKVVARYEHGTEPSSSIKCGKFLD